MNVLKTTVPVGIIFGILFGLVAYGYGFLNTPWVLLVMPLITGSLSGLGGLVATRVDKFLVAGGIVDDRAKLLVGFLAAAAVNVVVVLVILVSLEQKLPGREVVLSMLLGMGMGGVYGVYKYRDGRLKERMRFLEELAEKSRQLQDTTRRLAITEERNRLGRELHDSISQGLHGLVFSLHSLRREVQDASPRAKAIIDHMEDAATATLGELRAMIEELEPSLLARQGLAEALKTLTEMFAQRQEVPFELSLELPEELPPELEMVLYRVSQEALANIERHSGARHAALNISRRDNGLALVIRDDGRGFDSRAAISGNGLRNMRQRAEDAGGTLDVVSRPGLGTTITAVFPLKG